MKKINLAVQIGLPISTVAGFLLTALKLPQYGVVVSLFSQIFWMYSAYKAWRKADQIGLFVNTIIVTAVFAFGVINYWFIK
jgi:hypothetical protein